MKKALSRSILSLLLLGGCAAPPAEQGREKIAENEGSLQEIVDEMFIQAAREMRQEHVLPDYGLPQWQFGNVTPNKNADYYWSGNKIDDGKPLVVLKEDYFRKSREDGRLYAQSPCEEAQIAGSGTVYVDVAESAVRHELAHFYHDMVYLDTHGHSIAYYLAARGCVDGVESEHCLEDEVWIEGLAYAFEKCSMKATLEKVGVNLALISSGGWCRSGHYLQDPTCRAIAGTSIATEIMERDRRHGFARTAVYRLPAYSLPLLEQGIEEVLDLPIPSLDGN